MAWARRPGVRCARRCRRRWPKAATRALRSSCAWCRRRGCELALPCRIGDYTDFYTGIHHATTVGRLFRPDNPLLPNYKWVPIGYHGAPQHRPRRQPSPAAAARPSRRRPRRRASAPASGWTTSWSWASWSAAATRWASRCPWTRPRTPVRPGAAQRLVGARHPGLGIPAAGPVPGQELRHLDLAVGRDDGGAGAVPPALHAAAGDPQPLPYLDSAFNRAPARIDITLEVWLQTRRCAPPARRRCGCRRATRRRLLDLAQLVAHHTSNGCNLQPGDLLGTGTLSGHRPALSAAGAAARWPVPAARRGPGW
jgi:fumarylacetoacetase